MKLVEDAVAPYFILKTWVESLKMMSPFRAEFEATIVTEVALLETFVSVAEEELGSRVTSTSRPFVESPVITDVELSVPSTSLTL